MFTAGQHLDCEVDIYKQTIEKWGVSSQLFMAMEEMGELMVALSHYNRGRCDEDTVAEEIADVLLMAEEMAYVFGREKVIFWLEKKKDVIKQRLGEDEFRPAKEISEEMENEKSIHVDTSD